MRPEVKKDLLFAARKAITLLADHAANPDYRRAFIDLWETVRAAEEDERKVKNWWENDALEPRETCHDAAQIGTTYERLAYHLVNEHDLEPGFVSGRAKTELESWHDRFHGSHYEKTPRPRARSSRAHRRL